MSNDTGLPAILEDLAAGRIDPAEAARRIDALSATGPSTGSGGPTDASATTGPAAQKSAQTAEQESGDAWAESTDRPQRATHTREPVGPAATAPAAAPVTPSAPQDEETPGRIRVNRVTAPGGVDRISVRAIGRRVRIIGESSVATVSADGPHVLRRNGSVLEISSDGELGASVDGFQILRGAPRNLDDFRSLGLGKELLLRVNPSITVDVEVTAGSLHTERVPRLGKVRVTAGGAKLLDVAQVSDALIQAGQATVKGTITGGRSRIRTESGSLSIQLSDDSDVTVSTDAQLGKVSWGGGHTGSGDEVVMGDGRGKLEVEVLMGHATVRVGSEQTTGETAGQTGPTA